MAGARVMKGVLAGFLGTYMSRFSDFQGDWLFGWLVRDMETMRIDLMGTPSADRRTPIAMAITSAIEKFHDQVQKQGLSAERIEAASLTLRKHPGEVHGHLGHIECIGYQVVFTVEAAMVNGRRFQREQAAFVAPQDVAHQILRR